MTPTEFITGIRDRLKRCKSDLVLGNTRTRTDLTLAVEVIEVLVEALKFECGNRCAVQNPCNARDALAEIDELLKGSGEV